MKTLTHTRRPFWLTILTLFLLALSLTGWLRFSESIIRWEQLVQLGFQPGPLYLAVSGFLVGALGLAGGLGVWSRRSWAPAYCRILVITWLAWLWLDRLAIAVSSAAYSNWPFLAAASVLLLIGVFLILQRGRDWFL